MLLPYCCAHRVCPSCSSSSTRWSDLFLLFETVLLLFLGGLEGLPQSHPWRSTHFCKTDAVRACGHHGTEECVMYSAQSVRWVGQIDCLVLGHGLSLWWWLQHPVPKLPSPSGPEGLPELLGVQCVAPWHAGSLVALNRATAFRNGFLRSTIAAIAWRTRPCVLGVSNGTLPVRCRLLLSRDDATRATSIRSSPFWR